MSSTVKVTPEQVDEAIMDALARFGDEVSVIVSQASKDCARKGVKELKSTAPTGGDYARGWTHRGTRGAVGKIANETIYNRTDYQLTHLLEDSHDTGPHRGGSYPSGHGNDYTGTLALIEQKYMDLYIKEVLAKL